MTKNIIFKILNFTLKVRLEFSGEGESESEIKVINFLFIVIFMSKMIQ